MKLSEDPNVPVLEGGWVTLTEAAEVLGITRQHSYKRAKTGGYKTIRRIGASPAFVVNRSELEEIVNGRSAREEEQGSEALEKVSN